MDCKTIVAGSKDNSENMTAGNKVFNIYELFETIMLHVNPEDIFTLARVNKVSQAIFSLSTHINKILMKSYYFYQRISHHGPSYMNDNSTLAYLEVSSRGYMVVRKLPDIDSKKELVLIGRKMSQQLTTIFLTDNELIPGLTFDDHAMLRCGWMNILKHRESKPKAAFLRRLSRGLEKYMDTHDDEAEKEPSDRSYSGFVRRLLYNIRPIYPTINLDVSWIVERSKADLRTSIATRKG